MYNLKFQETESGNQQLISEFDIKDVVLAWEKIALESYKNKNVHVKDIDLINIVISQYIDLQLNTRKDNNNDMP